jgi:hypothetical protein
MNLRRCLEQKNPPIIGCVREGGGLTFLHGQPRRGHGWRKRLLVYVAAESALFSEPGLAAIAAPLELPLCVAGSAGPLDKRILAMRMEQRMLSRRAQLLYGQKG